MWVVWADAKVPRAPWALDHCYHAKWGGDAEPRPETTFEEAYEWADLDRLELAFRSDMFPDDEAKELHLGLSVLHSDADPDLALIDLDKVRDPDTGEVVPEAWEIVERADSFTEVSQSGTGLHVFVEGHLPGDMIQAEGEIGPGLDCHDQAASVELYSPIRFAAMTGEHVDGTPEEVRSRQRVVDELLREYDEEKAEKASSRKDHNAGTQGSDAGPEFPVNDRGGKSDAEIRAENGEGVYETDYYEEDLTGFAMPDPHNDDGPQGPQGCHPAHMPESSDPADALHYHMNPSENVWVCYSHGGHTGGGPLEMVYCLENGGRSACDALVKGTNVHDLLSDDEFLDLCVAAHNKYGFSDRPPRRALDQIAEDTYIPKKCTDALREKFSEL